MEAELKIKAGMEEEGSERIGAGRKTAGKGCCNDSFTWRKSAAALLVFHAETELRESCQAM